MIHAVRSWQLVLWVVMVVSTCRILLIFMFYIAPPNWLLGFDAFLKILPIDLLHKVLRWIYVYLHMRMDSGQRSARFTCASLLTRMRSQSETQKQTNIHLKFMSHSHFQMQGKQCSWSRKIRKKEKNEMLTTIHE